MIATALLLAALVATRPVPPAGSTPPVAPVAPGAPVRPAAPRVVPGSAPSPRPPAAPADTTVPTGDAELDSLQKQFAALSRWVAAKPAIGPDERREIDRFRSVASTYSAAHPENAAVVAMLAQAAAWIDDDEDVQGRFRRLAELRPGDGNVLASWGEYWLRRNQPEVSLREIDARPVDLTAWPRLAMVKARCLSALDRWAEAAPIIEAIPATAMLPPAQAGKLVELRRVATEWPGEQALREKEAQANDLPRVELTTNRGTMILELFEEQAPNTVANFISLAEKGFYDGTTFHRVIPGFMAQGGDPNTRPDPNRSGPAPAPGTGGPGYTIADEHLGPEARKHFTGSLAMAHHGPGTGGSQFYITFEPQVSLNGGYTVFGRVVEGLPILMRTELNDEIRSVKVLRKRPHEYVPATTPDPVAAIPPPTR